MKGNYVRFLLLAIVLTTALVTSAFAGWEVTYLHPAGQDSSVAYSVSGGQQVGYGSATGDYEHALLWAGTAGSVVDLHAYLPSQWMSSRAYGIDSSGNIVGYAWDENYTVRHAVLWVPQGTSQAIPEPATLSLFGIALAALLRRRRRRA